MGACLITTRWSLCLVVGLAVLALAGCQPADEIRRYQVPHADDRQDHVPPRMLAAILPHANQMWFFKLLGPAPAVGEHREAFERFVRSVRFTDKAEKPLSWTVPDDWRETNKDIKAAGIAGLKRYATFLLGRGDNPLELTVLPLPGKDDAASLLANVNRWRGQVGLEPVTEAELPRVTTQLKVGDAVATLVDVTGPGGNRAHAPAAVHPEIPAADLPFTFKAPEDWKPRPPGQIAVLAFQVPGDDQAAALTVTPLADKGGGLAANVNRWRAQLDLPPVGEDDIRRDLRHVTVSGSKAPLVDLLGPEKDGKRTEILGVILERDGVTWFFKMTGPAPVVTRQKTAFEALVQSVQFNGHKGAQK
jgi:hypothetical protein